MRAVSARLLLLVCALGGATSVLAGCPSEPAASNPACDGTQALSATGGAGALLGTSLGTKQLALTFDDGPGSRTVELSAFLKANGIPAVFFENGHCYAPGNPCRYDGAASDAATVLTQLAADGHLVANHTQDHLDLSSTTQFPVTTAGNAALLKELTDTDAIIAPYVPNAWFLFRAPFGSFSSRPYNLLHASPMDKYVGHIGWDIGGNMVGNDTTGYAADWACWQNPNPPNLGVKTTKKCGDRYMNQIKAVGRGIVLMHDADYGDVSNTSLTSGKGNTVDMVKYLVPLLKAAGYTFVRADDVPEIRALLPLVPDAGPEAGSDADADAAADPDTGVTNTSSSSSSSSGDPSASSSSSGGRSPGPDPCTAVAAPQATTRNPIAH
jgi:peptidoglycan/xylan/chitin deacetylase (PgdA/CDA1 family)